MQKNYLWQALKWPGLEHLRLFTSSSTIQVNSLMIAKVAGKPLRLAYRITCDNRWTVQHARIELLGENRYLELSSDGRGLWFDAHGRNINELDGCIDLDLSVTPFTNTLPIRRLGLKVGEKRAIRAAYVKAPELITRPAAQTYTCLAVDETGATYRYESGAFKAEVRVDEVGFIVDYPGIWQRLG
jgi:hypothetical protein